MNACESKRVPGDRLLKLPDVAEMCGFSRKSRHIYDLMRAGAFPRPIVIGAGAVRWPESEIEAWLASRPRGGPAVGVVAA